MLRRKILKLVSKIAIFLVVFASLAPSVSHALAVQNSGSFLQEICSTNGTKKVVIQTMTTKGQQLPTVFETKNSQPTPESVSHHLEHCPFCAAGAVNIAIAPAPAWILLLQAQANTIDFDYAAPVQPSFIQTAHPSRAPPVL
jgi:hypothetical protein